MGRKNYKARRRYNGATYDSFAELKNAGVRFDLSGADFIERKKHSVNAHKETEIAIRIVKHGHRNDEVLSCSIRPDIGSKMGEYLKVGIVCFGLMERLYFIGTDANMGFKLAPNSQQNSSRFYVRFPISDKVKQNYLKYVGEHELKYDYENAAYYVTSR